MEMYSKIRFSLLLLDPGEIYFEDFSAYMTKNQVADRLQGRLKLCSRSIVFEPQDNQQPLTKIPLSENHFEEKNGLLLACAKNYVNMLAGNILAPYEFIHETNTFKFQLSFGCVDNILRMVLQLQRAGTLPIHEHTNLISVIVLSLQSNIPFDKTWFTDIFEKIVYETIGNKILPLVMNPGRIVLTTTNLYYQPFNNIELQSVLIFPLKKITRVIRRRFLLQPIGLEIFTEDNKCFYAMLKSKEDRDMLHDKIFEQSDVKIDVNEPKLMTLRWQHRAVSNYDYLIYLNSQSDRSFNDLTQYPIFPWILSNYTSSNLDLTNPENFRDLSKPIGALNPTRLKSLIERRQAMPEPTFLYGSHYSAPGFVLFYLARKHPNYVLCLQNGRFDHPDRMFNNLADVWKNVVDNMADFKELTPEFYDPSNCGDFLLNLHGIDFGVRYDGSKVNDVSLPPWSTSPQDFIIKMRDALESDYVSESIHHWIDLIFGYKQRGQHAEETYNVFHWLCYEGSVDLKQVSDAIERHALEVQIMEFGQVPKQIFDLPHPPRFPPESPQKSLLLNTEPIWCDFDELKVTQCGQHKQQVNFVSIGQNYFCSVGDDGFLKVYEKSTYRLARSVQLQSLALSCCVILPGDNFIIVADANYELLVYDLEYGKVIDSIIAHVNTITSIIYHPLSSYLISSSKDCTVRLWEKCIGNDQQWEKLRLSCNETIDTQSPVECTAVSRNGLLLAHGCNDGSIYGLDLTKRLKTNILLNGTHSACVTSLAFNHDTLLASCSCNGSLQIHDMSTGMLVCEANLNLTFTGIIYDWEKLLLTTQDGYFLMWDSLQGCSKNLGKCDKGINDIAVCDNLVVTAGGNYVYVYYK